LKSRAAKKKKEKEKEKKTEIAQFQICRELVVYRIYKKKETSYHTRY